MLYHASQTPNIKILEPRISNHGKPLVYLSEKREKIIMNSYEGNSPQKLKWIEKTVREEYENPNSTAEYKYFLRCKFGL